jgi:putative spermidine/putrescine transport system permease protein
VLAHTALGAPFVVITVTATLSGFDHNLMRAAASLGAGPVTSFFRVMLPVIAPGVASGALFAFVTSFDEVVVALFISGSEQRTLPRQMWSGVRESLSPTITAVATLLIVASIALLAGLQWLQGRAARASAATP